MRFHICSRQPVSTGCNWRRCATAKNSNPPFLVLLLLLLFHHLSLSSGPFIHLSSRALLAFSLLPRGLRDRILPRRLHSHARPFTGPPSRRVSVCIEEIIVKTYNSRLSEDTRSTSETYLAKRDVAECIFGRGYFQKAPPRR